MSKDILANYLAEQNSALSESNILSIQNVILSTRVLKCLMLRFKSSAFPFHSIIKSTSIF